MYPELFTVPGLGLHVHSFSLMFLTACASALYLTAWRAKREGLDPNDVYDLALWLYPGGLIGARVFFLFQHPETIRSLADIVAVWQGGIVFYGCIAGGLTGSLIFWARRRFPLPAGVVSFYQSDLPAIKRRTARSTHSMRSLSVTVRLVSVPCVETVSRDVVARITGEFHAPFSAEPVSSSACR